MKSGLDGQILVLVSPEIFGLCSVSLPDEFTASPVRCSRRSHPGDIMSDDELRRILEEAIESSIWSVSGVNEEPRVNVRDWQVFELDGMRHIVGFHYEIAEGRVTTELQSLDVVARSAVTRSGRTNVFEGPPGRHPDADWVLGMWLGSRGKTWKDIRFIPEDELFSERDGEEG